VRVAAGDWSANREVGVRDGGLTDGSSRSDALGRFRIAALRAGSYRLSAAGEASARIVATGERDLELTLETHRILLMVVDEHGRPLDEVPVEFATLEQHADGARRPARTVRALTHGDPPTAAYAARPGSSVVVGAYVPGAPPVEETRLVTALPFETRLSLEVRFRPATAALVVAREGLLPPTRARVRLLAPGSRVAVGPVLTTDAAGRVDGLPAGSWLVEVDPLPAPGAIDCEPAILLPTPLALEPGATNAVVLAQGRGARRRHDAFTLSTPSAVVVLADGI
jgi:hypothetical protein